MEVRSLGSAGLVSSAVGLGAMAFTGVYGEASRSESDRVIRLALDMGITLFDAADGHTRDESETLLGRLLAHRRGDALIAAYGGTRTADGGRSLSVDGNPARLAADCDASLRRLGTDYIDLFYLSGVDPQVPVEDSIGKLAELVTEGKIRYLGLREAPPDQLRRAHATHPISALALEYSFLRRPAVHGPLAAAASLGVGVVSCCPLARGLLSGSTPTAMRTDDQAALRLLENEAAELDIGTARLALAWLLAQRDDLVPVPSTRRPVHLEMNATTPTIRLGRGTRARLA
jgi:aryl-alcohol dehydrogenase-like predicted oxidoreductase